MSTLLQIVPRTPGGVDGVGDYALTIFKKLQQNFGCGTVFATFEPETRTPRSELQVLPLESLPRSRNGFDHILLHYVNYGFQKRGVPFHLLSILRELRARSRGKLITVFHEIYASGPPWRSAFWLKPMQKRLARAIAHLSDDCIVSNENFKRQLDQMVPGARIEVHPIPSGLGEPVFSNDQITRRDPHQWVIVGGTALAQRSLDSFRRLHDFIPDSVSPKRLSVLGGTNNPTVRSLLADLPIESNYRPLIEAEEASQILATCAFAWFDYFHRRDVETSVVLKSSAFAAACAHAVVPVFPHIGSSISMNNDPLPGPFFASPGRSDIPTATDRPRTALEIYDWYQRNASSDRVVNAIAAIFAFHASR